MVSQQTAEHLAQLVGQSLIPVGYRPFTGEPVFAGEDPEYDAMLAERDRLWAEEICFSCREEPRLPDSELCRGCQEDAEVLCR